MAAQAFGAKLCTSSVRCVGMLIRSRVQIILLVGTCRGGPRLWISRRRLESGWSRILSGRSHTPWRSSLGRGVGACSTIHLSKIKLLSSCVWVGPLLWKHSMISFYELVEIECTHCARAHYWWLKRDTGKQGRNSRHMKYGNREYW